MSDKQNLSLQNKEAPSRRLITIACAGNWLVSCDAIGPRVFDDISFRYDDSVRVVEAGAGGLHLIDHLHGQDLFIIVDASVIGDVPGTVCVREFTDLQTAPGGYTSTHQIGPVEALVIAGKLFPENMPKRTLFILVNTQQEPDESCTERLCREVVTILDREVGFIE
jgi:hydrogenase maturation protease